MQKRRVFRHEVIQPQDQSIKLIPLTKGQTAVVDSEDYDWLMQWNWFAMWSASNRSFYAARCEQRKTFFMHCEVAKNNNVDHANRNTLDNTKRNLRPCSRSENSANRGSFRGSTSIFKGVSYSARHKCFVAQIQRHGKKKHIGHFSTAIDAAKAYDKYALEYFGEFAHLNFPVS